MRLYAHPIKTAMRSYRNICVGENRFSLFMESRANACIIIFGLQNDKMFFCSPKTR